MLPVVFLAQYNVEMAYNIEANQFLYLQEIRLLQIANQKNQAHDALNTLKYISLL